MEQIAILDVLRRHAVMIIALTVIATVAGYAFTFVMHNRYSVSARVLVRPQQPIKMTEKGNREFLDFPMGSAATVETASKTYIEIIKTPALISEVVKELGLDKDAARDQEGSGKLGFLPTSLRGSLKRLMQVLTYGGVIQEDPFAKTVKEVSDGLALEATLDTYIFELKYTAGDAQKAADVANTTAKTLIKFVDQLRLSESQHQLDYLKAQLEQSRQTVDKARERLENYKQAHAIFLPEKEYDTQLKVLGDLEVSLAQAEQTLVGSQNTLTAVSLAAKRARLARMVNERKAELASLPQMERELKQLDQDVKDTVTAYEVVQREFKEQEIRQSYMMPEVRLLSAAIPPYLPSGPQRGLTAGVCLLGGLVVAIGLALLLEYLNRRVRSIHDVEDFVGVKVLATIPHVSARRWREAALL